MDQTPHESRYIIIGTTEVIDAFKSSFNKEDMFDPAEWHSFPFHPEHRPRPTDRFFQANYDGREAEDEDGKKKRERLTRERDE